MKKQNNLFLGISESAAVDQFMAALEHPMRDVISYLRSFILQVDNRVGEGVYWNAPTFYYTGQMEPFTVKEYKRYIIGFVLNRTDCVRMVLLSGAAVDDGSGFLDGDFKDGRRLVVFKNMSDVKAKEKELKKVIKKWLALVK